MTEMTEQERLSQMRERLARRIAEMALVKDAQAGYIFCPPVNHLVNPNLLQKAVKVASGLFLDNLPLTLQPEKVVGVAGKGKELGAAFGLIENLEIAVSEREFQGAVDERLPPAGRYEPEEDKVFIKNVPSFTKGGYFRHILHGVQPGDKLLVADDFSAFGHTANSFGEGLRQLRIKPVFVFLVAKDFPHLDPPQIGYRKLKEEEKFPAFAVVRFTGIENGQVIATAEDI